MFLLKSVKDLEIFSPAIGKCIEIEDVQDEMFSNRVLGDGAAIIPVGNAFHSPIDGTLVMIAKTNHAFGIESESGVSVLVHIGIKTVALDGRGFARLMDTGRKVKQGDEIIRINREKIPPKTDLTTSIIITQSFSDRLEKYNQNKDVSTKDLLLRIGNQ